VEAMSLPARTPLKGVHETRTPTCLVSIDCIPHFLIDVCIATVFQVHY
jgi:hypothetical protein